MGKCPLCHQPIEPLAILVSLDRNLLSVGWSDELIKLTPAEAEIMYVLWKKMPGSATRAFITQQLWGVNECGDPDGVIRALVSRIRRRIAKLGLTIQAIEGSAYILMETRYATPTNRNRCGQRPSKRDRQRTNSESTIAAPRGPRHSSRKPGNET